MAYIKLFPFFFILLFRPQISETGHIEYNLQNQTHNTYIFNPELWGPLKTYMLIDHTEVFESVQAADVVSIPQVFWCSSSAL